MSSDALAGRSVLRILCPIHLSDVLVVLKPQRDRSLEDLEAAMRSQVSRVPGATALFTTPLGMRIDEGLGGTPADISVRVFGPDLNKLAELGEQVRRVMSKVRGVTDLRAEKLTGLPQLRINIDRQAVARVGLTAGDVIRAIRIGLAGEEVSEVWLGQRRFDLVVRLRDEKRGDPNAIQSLLVDGHDGSRIPLGQLAQIEETFGPGSIRRESGSRGVMQKQPYSSFLTGKRQLLRVTRRNQEGDHRGRLGFVRLHSFQPLPAVRSSLLALGRQSERLMNHDYLALNLAYGTHAHAIMSEGIPD